MQRIEAAGNVAIQPSMPAAVNSPGFFKSGTTVDYGFLNNLMQEVCLAIEGQGMTLDRDNQGQLYNAIIAGLVSDGVSVAGGSTLHKVGLLISHLCTLTGAYAVAIASKSVEVAGDHAVGIACDFTGVTGGKGVTGDACAAIGCSNFGDVLDVNGIYNVVAASQDPITGAATSFGALLGTGQCEQSANYGAAIGGRHNKNKSNVGSVLLASLYCDSSTDTVPDPYTVFGGYHASAAVEPSWVIESNGGNILGKGTVANAGLDYAEWFENGDGVAHAPGRFLTRVGRKAVLATLGKATLGIVSVRPTITGGDDSLAWKGKWLVDKWGVPLLDDTGSGILNPDYVPGKGHTPRKKRPTEHTRVGLVGQMRVAVDATVKVDDLVVAGQDGVGTTFTAAHTGALGRRVECMEILVPFDEAEGYGIALCLVG